MGFLKKRIDEFILEAQVMITNSRSDPVVKRALSGYGFTEEKLLAGEKLYDEVVALQILRMKQYGERVAATAEFNNLWKTVNEQYMKTLKVARAAFIDNPKADKALMLQGDRKQSFSGWLEQAQLLYDNLLNETDLMDVMAGYGYSPEKLQREAALLDQAVAKRFQQDQAMGKAEEATVNRDKKIIELTQWLSQLRAVAMVALADDPQQLEKLGIVVKG